MNVTDSAYIAVLENKLIQAERSLDEFRRIFEYWTRRIDGTRTSTGDGEHVGGHVAEVDLETYGKYKGKDPRRKGLYPGQRSHLIDPSDLPADLECTT